MPLVRRPRLSLDGRWELSPVDVPDVPGFPSSMDVDVPGSWTLQVPESQLATGTVRYSRRFTVPADWPDTGRLVLLFGAVNQVADVFVNGELIGTHVGGWTPFEVSIDPELLTGVSDLLEVVVSYPPLLGNDPGAVRLQELPHGKQTWYGANAGIWQPVVLEHRPQQHIRQALVRPDASTGQVRVSVVLAEAPCAGTDVTVTVREHAATGDGRAVATARAAVAAWQPGDEPTVVLASVGEPALWSPDAPARYDVHVALREDGTVVDVVDVTTGFRTVDTKDGNVVLNGAPIELRGVLDQDYHPGSEVRARSGEELETLFIQAKRLGFNLLRCHIKRPDPIYFEVADRVGLLVWAELPSWQRFTPRAAAAAESLLSDMIELDGHHPSIVAWTVVNESWGVDLRDPDQRAWLARTQQRAKELAPGTLVVDNSACDPNFHVRSDLEDFHIYRGIPERRASWDAAVEELASRPTWTFSPYGDADRTGAEPIVLSEFGNWGLPDITESMGEDGSDPWWAVAGEDWAFGAAHASDILRRFRRLGLDQVFGSWQQFVDATQRQQLLANRYQLGSIRRRPEIAGYVLTQLGDVQWEANGLFDMDRRPRPFLDELALINGPAAVVVRPAAYRYSGLSGTAFDVTVDVVPPRANDVSGEQWRVVLDVNGAATEERPVPAGAQSQFTATVVLPGGPTMAAIGVELHVDGRLRARDVAQVAVLAPPVERRRPVRTSDAALAGWLPDLGVPVAGDSDDDALLVTRRLDEAAQAVARRGGKVLVVVEDRDAFADAFAAPLLARLSPREGDGDWVPRFDWLRRSGPLRALPGDPLLDLAFEGVIGDLVIDFLPAPLRPAYLHSAVFAGWLQHRASTSLTVPWGQGAVTISTFRLRAAGSEDPVAVALTRALMEVADQ